MAKYTIAADGQSITCRTCRTVSHRRGDIRWRYCGFCRKYHEEVAGWWDTLFGRLARWMPSMNW